MPQFPRLLLAVSPGNTIPQLPASVELAHMAYRIGPRCRLLRTRPELDLNGGFLMISGAASSCLGDLERFCLQVLSECRIHHAIGVIANWELHPQCVPLATRLDHTLAQVGLEFWVPEYYAESAAGAKVFISSQISGGSLTACLQEALSRWGSRTTLAIECTPWMFQLPCASGRGTPLNEEQLRQLMADRAPRFWFSESLCSQYFTYQEENQLCLVLFENAASVRKKLALATRLGLDGAVLSWDEVTPFAQELFYPIPKQSGRARF